jgi:hypothetical protein
VPGLRWSSPATLGMMPTPSSPASPNEPDEGLPPPPSARAAETSGLDLLPSSLPAPRSAAPAPTPTAPRRTTLFVVIAAAAVLVVAVVGGAFLLLRGSTAELLRMAPADVDLVVVAHLDPAAGQKVHLARLRAAVPSLATSAAFDGRLRSALDDLLAGTGLRGDDVVGWIGAEIAFVADVADGEPRAAGLFHVGDRDGAQTMLAKLATPGAPWDGLEWRERDLHGHVLRVAGTASGGTVAYAFVDDVLVIADDDDLLVRIVETADGRHASIDTTSAFQGAEAELPGERLLLAYANPAPFLSGEALGSGDGVVWLPQLLGVGELEAVRGIGLAVTARPEGFVVDVTVRYYTSRLFGPLRERLAAADEDHAIVPRVPADAWGVIAVRHADVAWPSFPDAIRGSEATLADDLDRLGLSGLSGHAVGDAALVLLGAEPAGVVLTMEIDDDASTRNDLDAAMRRLVSPVPGTSGIRNRKRPDAERVR